MSTTVEQAAPARHSGAEFVMKTMDQIEGEDIFEVVAKRFVRIDVDGPVWIKRGMAVAYRGDLKFVRERVLQKSKAKEIVARGLVSLVQVKGKGRLYCSDDGKHHRVARLNGGKLHVLASSLLAFENSLEHTASLVKKVGLLQGGLFTIDLKGTGLMALSTKGDPLTLKVSPDDPVITDPKCTIAWTGGLSIELKTDFEMRSLIGYGGGEEIMMRFKGEGYVVVQGKQEDPSGKGVPGTIKSLTKKII